MVDSKPKKHPSLYPKSLGFSWRWQAQVSFSLGSLVQFEHSMSRCRSLFNSARISKNEEGRVIWRVHRSFVKFDHRSHLDTTSANNTRIRGREIAAMISSLFSRDWLLDSKIWRCVIPPGESRWSNSQYNGVVIAALTNMWGLHHLSVHVPMWSYVPLFFDNFVT